MRSCFLSCICSHSKKIYFTPVYSCKNNNTFSDLFFELISKITKSVHVNALYLGSKEFHSHSALRLCILGAAFIAAFVLDVNVIYIILATALVGVISALAARKRGGAK